MPLSCLPPETVVTGWDFSTGSVKCLAFDLQGNVLAEAKFPTDLWTDGGVSELSLLQLEGQAHHTTRAIAEKLRDLNRLKDWSVGGISATHHTSGRIDSLGNQIRRAICWNDQTLAKYHAKGIARLGGEGAVPALIGGPWAVRYSLSHLVKDEETLPSAVWERTFKVLPHGPLAAGYLTGNFGVTSVSSAASTGMMDLRTNSWCRDMLNALETEAHRESVWNALPQIIDADQPVGPLKESLALEARLPAGIRPLLFPTLDDQAAGLVGGGAVNAGQLAIILGNSAVVNSSANHAPKTGSLDAMKLNWGPYLWMRCYSNGAQFLDKILGPKADFDSLEAAAKKVPPGCNGTAVLPFVLSEPSLGVHAPKLQWFPSEPSDPGVRFRACLEALAYLIGLAVREHVAAGQTLNRVAVSGGIAKSNLMGEILASVIDRPLERLQSDEGSALGGAVAALSSAENYWRKQRGVKDEFTVEDAVKTMVRFREPVRPVGEWVEVYKRGIAEFEARLS